MTGNARGQLIHIASEIVGRPLLILPEKLAVIAGVLGERIGIDAGMIELGPRDAATDAPANDIGASRFVGKRYFPDTGEALPYARTEDGTAVITITGSLVNRGAWVGASSGLTSYEGIQFQLAQAIADPKVRAIVLDLQSPGGQAVGAFETAAAVRQAAGRKPVTAIVNGMAASAAYAIASGAGRIVTTPSGISGSIGVVLLHADWSRLYDRAGVTPTLIFAGKHKVDGNPYQPLTAAVKAELQAEINEVYAQFVAAVAAGRKGLSEAAIRATEARTYLGQAAIDAGLADELGTFDAALATISRGAGRRTVQRTTTMDYTQADLDRARAQGHEAGKAEGHAAGKAEGHKLGYAAGVAEGTAQGAAAERTRIAAILGADEAKGREAAARQLALSTDMAAAAIKGVLAALPQASSLAERAGSVPHAGGGGDAKPAGGALSPDELAAAVNKQLGGAR